MDPVNSYPSLSLVNVQNLVAVVRWRVGAGASTPYKRWSKCTMEKVGGSVFAET